MNCSDSCAATLNGSPTSSQSYAIVSIGSTLATVSLNSLDYNGTTSAPLLTTGQILYFGSNGTNYFGNMPTVAGSNCTNTVANNNATFNCTGGSGSGNKISYGSFSSFPSSPSNGDLFITSNSPHSFVYNGSSWIAYDGLQGPPLVSFSISGWTWHNQNSWTGTTPDQDPILSCSSSCTDGNTGDEVADIISSSSLSIPYSLSVHLIPSGVVLNNNANEAVGLVIRESSNSNLIHFGDFIQSSTSGAQPYINAAYFTSETQHGSSNIFNSSRGIAQPQYGYWVCVLNNSTNRTYWTSGNGVDWFQVGTQSSGTNLTENQYGIGVYLVGSTTIGGTIRYDHLEVAAHSTCP
jgi:hypothetical protein